MNLSDADWERLERYASYRGTPEELAETERWVNASDELRAIARGMRTAGLPPGSEEPEWNEEVAWHRVSRRLRWFSRPSLASTSTARRRIERWTAAAVILVVAIPSMVIALRHRSAPVAPSAATAPAPARELASRRGERAAFDLPDGTRVMLGAASRLRVPGSYNQPGAGRDVYLDGEAYFEVTHDSLRPFRVHTALGIAEDLGTEFVVSTYPEVRGMRVVVASGVVAVHRDRRGAREREPGAPPPPPLVTLTRGDLARLDSAGTATVRQVDPAPYLAWTRGTLAFRGAPLRDVVPQLARWYDIDLRLAGGALGNRRLTASFSNHSVDQVLNL
ncbi:MAG TPA: FecR domain-containing protein, partial [Gemmatimonadales bacterium]|nr:FecR domain-containing protein [Gemmatimonadales bacterium]